MKTKTVASALALLLTLSAFAVRGEAQNKSDIPFLLEGTKPRLLLIDTFDRERLTEIKDCEGHYPSRDRQVANGQTIKLEDGRLIIRHCPKKHPLLVYFILSEEARMRDVAAYVRFRLPQEGDSLSVGFNGQNVGNNKRRICGVGVREAGYGVSDVTEKNESRGSSAEAPIALQTWHTMFLVIQNGKATFQVNDLKPVVLESKGLTYVKETLKFGPTKCGFEIDELKIWSLDQG